MLGVSYFKSLQGPDKGLIALMVTALLGSIGTFVIWANDEFFFLNTEKILILPIAIASISTLVVLWFTTKGEKVRKILFMLLLSINLFFYFYFIFYPLLFLYVKLSADKVIFEKCVPVVGFIDYKPNNEYVGKTLIVKYNEVEREITVPEIEAEKMNGNFPKCLKVKLSKCTFDTYYVHEVEW